MPSTRCTSSLGHLARRVRASRLIAASRLEIPLAAAGVTPVVTRLAALEEPAARRMLAHLGRRLGVEVADVQGILARAGGSPFYLQREVASSLARTGEPVADRLGSTLQALPAVARRLLLRAAAICDRVGVAELALGGPPIDAWLALLVRHFFIEIVDGMVAVHDLVRGAALRLASPAEILRARRAAARIFIARSAAGGAEGALATVEAVRTLCAAGDHDEAHAFIAERHGVVSGAGLDHLLVESLEELRAAAPAHATSIDLVLARILVRRALVAEAQEVLSRLAADGTAVGSVRYLSLAGTIAAQRGDLRGAETCLQGAHDAARPDAAGGAERARIALHLADVLSLRGETVRARAVLDDVREVCESLRGRTVLRWGWSAGLSWVIEKDFARTIATVAPFRELAVKLGASDLAAQLTMLEVLARAESHDAAGARELTDKIVAPAARAGALRAPIASFYVGVTSWAEGDLRTAAVALRDTWTFLHAHSTSRRRAATSPRRSPSPRPTPPSASTSPSIAPRSSCAAAIRPWWCRRPAPRATTTPAAAAAASRRGRAWRSPPVTPRWAGRGIWPWPRRRWPGPTSSSPVMATSGCTWSPSWCAPPSSAGEATAHRPTAWSEMPWRAAARDVRSASSSSSAARSAAAAITSCPPVSPPSSPSSVCAGRPRPRPT